MARSIKYQEEKWSNNENDTMETEFKRPQRKHLIWIILLLLVGLGVWGLSYFDALPGNNTYQAVFLNNGQVYFGKLSRSGGQYPVLRDIYYLQITQPIQPSEGGSEENAPNNINLVKLGEELHGPQDEMRINRDNILFIEDLREDSRIVQAIKQLKENK